MNSSVAIRGIVVACLLCTSVAAAQSNAVERTHVEFTASTSDSDTANSTSSGTIDASLIATLPLGRYFGAALSGGYSQSNVRTRDVLLDSNGSLPGGRPSCDFDRSGGDASLFLRRPTLGKVAVTYGVGDLSADCDGDSRFPVSGEDSLRTDNYRFDAELYLGNFTVAAARTTTSLDSGPNLEATTLGASWYPFESVKVSLSGHDLYDEDTYAFEIEHQPEIFADRVGVNLGYATTDASPKTRSFHLGLSYYFGRSVPLQVRDRHYR